MNTMIKKIKTHVGKDRTLHLDIPNMPTGDVEVIVLKSEGAQRKKKLETALPRHRMGKILTSLRREDIYEDAR